MNNVCFYLDASGNVAKTDTKGNSTPIFDLSDQPAFAIAYGMQISNQTGTISLLCSPNNDAGSNRIFLMWSNTLMKPVQAMRQL